MVSISDSRLWTRSLVLISDRVSDARSLSSASICLELSEPLGGERDVALHRLELGLTGVAFGRSRGGVLGERGKRRDDERRSEPQHRPAPA